MYHLQSRGSSHKNQSITQTSNRWLSPRLSQLREKETEKMSWVSGAIGLASAIFVDLMLFVGEWVLTGKIGAISLSRFVTRLQLAVIIIGTLYGLMDN